MKTIAASKSFLDTLATSLTSLLSNGLERIFGTEVHRQVIGPISFADLGVFVCFLLLGLLLHWLAASVLRRKRTGDEAQPEAKHWRAHILTTIDKPLYLLIWIYGIYLAVAPLLLKLALGEPLHPVRQLVDLLFNLGIFVVLFWLFFRLTRVLEARLASWAKKTDSKLDDLVVPLLGRTLRVVVPVLGPM